MSLNRDDLRSIRRLFHECPEPGFEEYDTQRLVLQLLEQFDKSRFEVKTWRTGVLVRIHGSNPRRCIGYRADMDGLPLTEETGLPFASKRKGYMHACGHDMHMTIAMGVISHLFQNSPVDDVVVIFQPAEEGPGGAEPMLASAEFQSWRPDVMFALHIAPEYPVGTIATRAGLLFANTSELFIDFTGKGGHAAYPHLSNDMVVAAAQFVSALQTIVSRNVDPLDSAVITIGRIEGGTKQNIIAEHARLEGTIRTLSPTSMQNVKSRIEALLRGWQEAYCCEVSLDYGAGYHQVTNDAAWIDRFANWIQSSPSPELPKLQFCKEAMTGEDFGYFLKEIPGFMFWLGVNSPYGLHHNQMSPDESALYVAVSTVSQWILEISKHDSWT